MTNTNTTPRLGTLYVLAGAYRGKRASLKVLLTHTVDLDNGHEIAICGQPNMGDEGGVSESELALPPTCPKCLRKDTRFKK